MSINPLLTNYGPSASLYAPASGGGGGGGGDNPVVSSITWNGGSIYSMNFPAGTFARTSADANLYSRASAGAAATIELDIIGQDTITSNTGIILQSGSGGTVELSVNSGAGNILTNGGPISITPGRSSGSVQAPPYGMMIDTSDGASLYTFSMAANNIVNDVKGVSSSVGYTGLRTLVNAANAYIGYPSGLGATDGGQMNLSYSTMAISAPSTLSLTAPTVLVNGVPYGGGGSVGPNLAVSSLTFGGTSNPAMFMENKTIQLNPAGSAEVAGLSWNNSSSNIQLIAPSTTYAYMGTSALLNGVKVEDGAVTAGPQLTTSNLTVSSVNGAAYPPASSGSWSAQRINWLNSGTNTLPAGATPGAWTALTNPSASLTNGHTYRMTAVFGASNPVGDGLTELAINGTWGGLPASMFQEANVNLSSPVTSIYGYTGYFTTAGGAGGGVTLSGFNTGTGITTVTGDAAYVILEDLGALA